MDEAIKSGLLLLQPLEVAQRSQLYAKLWPAGDQLQATLHAMGLTNHAGKEQGDDLVMALLLKMLQRLGVPARRSDYMFCVPSTHQEPGPGPLFHHQHAFVWPCKEPPHLTQNLDETTCQAITRQMIAVPSALWKEHFAAERSTSGPVPRCTWFTKQWEEWPPYLVVRVQQPQPGPAQATAVVEHVVLPAWMVVAPNDQAIRYILRSFLTPTHVWIRRRPGWERLERQGAGQTQHARVAVLHVEATLLVYERHGAAS